MRRTNRYGSKGERISRNMQVGDVVLSGERAAATVCCASPATSLSNILPLRLPLVDSGGPNVAPFPLSRLSIFGPIGLISLLHQPNL
jgi:hypothetical protein